MLTFLMWQISELWSFSERFPLHSWENLWTLWGTISPCQVFTLSSNPYLIICDQALFFIVSRKVIKVWLMKNKSGVVCGYFFLILLPYIEGELEMKNGSCICWHPDKHTQIGVTKFISSASLSDLLYSSLMLQHLFHYCSTSQSQTVN